MKNNIKGLILVLCLAVPSWYLGKLFPIIGGPVFGIILGMILTNFIRIWT